VVKAIIVDDEPITREGLIDFIEWDKLGVEIIGEAEDGIEGLELAKSGQPDIVICDIKMPRMDGISFASQLKEALPSCKVIFLSGYSDVEYLKSAIKINAVDYVEKPVDIEEFEELIKKTVLLCRKEKMKQLQEKELMDKVQRSIPYLQNRLILDIMGSTEADTEKINENLKYIGSTFTEDGQYICCVIKLRDNGMQGKVIENIRSLIQNTGIPFIIGFYEQFIVVVILAGQKYGNEDIYGYCQHIKEAVKNEFNISLTIGVGRKEKGLLSIKNSYIGAVDALKYEFYEGPNMVFRYNFSEGSIKGSLLFDREQFVAVENCLKREDIKSAAGLINDMIDDLKVSKNPEVEQARKALFNIYLLISRIYEENVFEIESDNDILWAKVFMTGELSNIRTFINNRLMAIEDRINLTKNNREKSVIKDVEDYIKENYNRDISISCISDKVYLTPTYLCLLFKKEKGETINDYLTKVRIEKSKVMLTNRRYKLYEVARMVGYNDANYFAKVFKKITGYNPSDYRDNVQ
jgi:Response regulator containing CheY-like receiver domain and AraC-type DNA-binding domain